MTDEEMAEESKAAWDLFRTCGHAGLVKSFDPGKLEEDYEDD